MSQRDKTVAIYLVGGLLGTLAFSLLLVLLSGGWGDAVFLFAYLCPPIGFVEGLVIVHLLRRRLLPTPKHRLTGVVPPWWQRFWGEDALWEKGLGLAWALFIALAVPIGLFLLLFLILGLLFG